MKQKYVFVRVSSDDWAFYQNIVIAKMWTYPHPQTCLQKIFITIILRELKMCDL